MKWIAPAATNSPARSHRPGAAFRHTIFPFILLLRIRLALDLAKGAHYSTASNRGGNAIEFVLKCTMSHLFWFGEDLLPMAGNDQSDWGRGLTLGLELAAGVGL